jgi:hypothetical protein
LPPPELELRPLSHPACSQSLYRLCYPGSASHDVFLLFCARSDSLAKTVSSGIFSVFVHHYAIVRDQVSHPYETACILRFSTFFRDRITPLPCLSIYSSTALCWSSAVFSVFLSLTRSVGIVDGGSARRKAATYTQDSTNIEYTHKDIHASSGIRTHNPNVRASEDSSRLRPRGHCDRHTTMYREQSYNLPCSLGCEATYVNETSPVSHYILFSLLLHKQIQENAAMNGYASCSNGSL